MNIYAIRNFHNGKLYVGKTLLGVEARWRAHVKEAKANGQRALCRAIRKYGQDAFTIEAILCVLDAAALDEMEVLLIKNWRTMNPRVGYNQTPGGEGGATFTGHRHSEETKRKISQKLKTIAQVRQPYVWTDEARRNLSRAMMGNQNFKNQERRGRSRAGYGGSQKGHKVSAVTKEKLRAAALADGRRPPNQTGFVMPEDAKRRIAESSRLRWAKQRLLKSVRIEEGPERYRAPATIFVPR